METVTVNINNNLITFLENCIEDNIYPNKSECIRAATRNLLLYHGKLKLLSKTKERAFIPKPYKKEVSESIGKKCFEFSKKREI